jgi:DNA-binding HxlR family transcriptional regulator
MIDTLSKTCQYDSCARVFNEIRYDNKLTLTYIKRYVSSFYISTMVSLEIMSRDIDKEIDIEKNRTLNLQPEYTKDSSEMQLLKTISNGKEFIATDRYAVILHLYRNGPMNMKDINDELPGSTEILRDLERLKVVRQEIDSSRYPQETRLELTEKGKEIGDKLEEVEKMMEEIK